MGAIGEKVIFEAMVMDHVSENRSGQEDERIQTLGNAYIFKVGKEGNFSLAGG